jgi:hypothetical protein
VLPTEIYLAEKAYRSKMLGLDFALPMGSWMFRFEGAWQQTRDYIESEFIPFPELSYEAEIEKTGDHINLIAGYYGKYILDFIGPFSNPELKIDHESISEMINSGFPINEEIENKIDAFNRMYNYQLEEVYHSAFLVSSGNLFYNSLEYEIPVIYNITTGEWTIRPSLTIKPFDGFHLKVGYEGYFGRSGSLYDLVGPVLNSGFLSVKIIF